MKRTQGKAPQPTTGSIRRRSATEAITRLGLWALLGLWLLTLPAKALGDDNRFDAARTAYAAGQFAVAAKHLEAAYADGARNAASCLGAAQAWRLAGHEGRAAVWLAKAALLDPGSRHVRQALATAGLARPGHRLVLAGRLSPRVLAWLALGGNAAFWLGLMHLRRRRRRLPVALLVAAGLLVGWLWLEAGVACLGPRLWPQGIVVAALAVQCAPEAGAEERFTLPIGRLVTLGPVRDGYRQVTDGEGRLGWLPSRAVADIDF